MSLLGRDKSLKVWITKSISTALCSLKPTIGRGATHCICSNVSLFLNVRLCRPPPAGGCFRLGQDCRKSQLIAELYNNHSITTNVGKDTTTLHNGIILPQYTPLQGSISV